MGDLLAQLPQHAVGGPAGRRFPILHDRQSRGERLGPQRPALVQRVQRRSELPDAPAHVGDLVPQAAGPAPQRGRSQHRVSEVALERGLAGHQRAIAQSLELAAKRLE